jgi:hypothetical protein
MKSFATLRKVHLLRKERNEEVKVMNQGQDRAKLPQSLYTTPIVIFQVLQTVLLINLVGVHVTTDDCIIIIIAII